MKNLTRFLNRRLVVVTTLTLVVATLAMLSSQAAGKTIVMDATPAIVSPGSVLTLRGEQSFNPGQLAKLTFFIGEAQIEPQALDANTVRLTVPELAPGIYSVRVVKHAGHPGSDILEFSQAIEIGGERVLSSVSGVISPGGGRLELPGVARFELVEESERPPVTMIIADVLAPGETPFFRNYLAAEGVPQVTTDRLVRIFADQRIGGHAGVRLRVPEEIRSALTPDLAPELYAEIPNLTASEDVGEYLPLNAEYNPETGELSAPFAGSYFHDAEAAASVTGESVTSGAAGAEVANAAPQDGSFNAQQQLRFSGRLRVSVRRFGARRVPLTAITAFPSAPEFEAAARETLDLQSRLDIKIPQALRNPTAHGGPRSPVLNDDYSESHRGLDLRSADNDPIYAAADGTVARIFNNVLPGHPRCNPTAQRGGGWSIAIDHPDGSRTSYSHLVQDSQTVREGQEVTAGQQIALADHTGGTCPSGPGGAHLHFGYRIDGLLADPTAYLHFDPEEFRQLWLDQLSVIAVVDGTPVQETRRRVTDEVFDYRAALDLSKLDLQPNRTYPFSLRLMTADGQTADFYTGQMKIKSAALRVVLTWDTADTDVDLHVRDSNGNEAWYADPTGIPGAFLDHDDVDGFGPEVFTMEALAPDTTYTVFLHYFSDHGNGPTSARTVVYLDGREVTNDVATLSDDQFHTVGTYPPAPPPHGSHSPARQGPAGADRGSRPVSATFRPTGDPSVWEYTLPSLPNVTLRLVRKQRPWQTRGAPGN